MNAKPETNFAATTQRSERATKGAARRPGQGNDGQRNEGKTTASIPLPSSLPCAFASSRLCASALNRFVRLGLVIASVSGCSKHAESPQQPPPEVTVSRPAQEQVADAIELTGTVAPFQSVDLVARVSGYLRSVDFQDGSIVEAGKPLFLIEPEPYEQQMALAKAARLRAQAEFDRQSGLILSNATSVANVEKWLSERDQARAQEELARINLGYTRVTAPFTGRIGRHLVDPGNLVGPSVNSRLATIEQLSPIFVYFNLNERDALRLWEAMRQRDIKPGSSKALVEVGLQSEQGYPHRGTLDFVNTGVSTSSGTVQLRAVLTNEDRALFPGLFARVRIPLGDAQPMLVVPNAATGNDQGGDFVLVVGANEIVARRSIIKGPLTKTGCAIRSGIAAEDRVIVAGILRAKPGAKVTPVSR